GVEKTDIKEEIEKRFGYSLGRNIDEIRKSYSFDVSCQGTVPEAIICFLESGSYEDAIRNAISIGGDSDTIACITGGISEAFYGPVPDDINKKVEEILPPELMRPVRSFYDRYMMSSMH
ncbi:MAG: ADP-ribosylglycohydrolase family protein, partial [Deltaproteobacteria bacterium]|nr:ADP-ribosylglycohydrolase family protein [Deltaproteobacteria bacterium]